MALTDVTAGVAPCPECGQPGPYNFKYEDRVSVRRTSTKDKTKLSAMNIKRVLVCSSCGYQVATNG